MRVGRRRPHYEACWGTRPLTSTFCRFFTRMTSPTNGLILTLGNIAAIIPPPPITQNIYRFTLQIPAQWLYKWSVLQKSESAEKDELIEIKGLLNYRLLQQIGYYFPLAIVSVYEVQLLLPNQPCQLWILYCCYSEKCFIHVTNNLVYNVRDSFTSWIFFGPVVLICTLHVRLSSFALIF